MSAQSLPVFSFLIPVTVVSMTLLVWFTVTPAKSGSVMGVEIHLAGKWSNDGNNNDKLVLECLF